MKFVLMLVFLFTTQLGLSQTMREKKIKEEMLDRLDTLILMVGETREALQREDVITACHKINNIFRLLPEHLVAIGTRMNIFESKVMKLENETKMFLIYVHQRKNICAIGETGENLDIGETSRKFKSMEKKLKKQKRNISKAETNFENSYHYFYEFH